MEQGGSMAYGKSRGKFVNNGTEAKCGHRCRQEGKCGNRNSWKFSSTASTFSVKQEAKECNEMRIRCWIQKKVEESNSHLKEWENDQTKETG